MENKFSKLKQFVECLSLFILLGKIKRKSFCRKGGILEFVKSYTLQFVINIFENLIDSIYRNELFQVLIHIT